MNIIYIPFIFYYCGQTLFTLRVSSLLSSLTDDSVDIVDDEGSLEISPKAEFTSALCIHITLARDYEAESLLAAAAVLKAF